MRELATSTTALHQFQLWCLLAFIASPLLCFLKIKHPTFYLVTYCNKWLVKLLPVTFSKTLISPTALEHTIATIPVLLLCWFMAANPEWILTYYYLTTDHWFFSIIHWNDLIDLNTSAQSELYHLLINFSCYMLPINILIYTVYPSIISQGLFFCTKSGRSFKGQRLFEEENIPSLPSAPRSDGWTQTIKFSFTSLAISLFSNMGLKDQILCIEAHCTYFIHSLSSDLYSDLVVIY